MADLLAKRRAARETLVEADGHQWTLRRPTAYERAGMSGSAPFDLLCRYIVGWNLLEIDLIPGGSPEAVPFDADLLADYLADRPQLWGPLIDALTALVKAHDDALEDAVKN